MLTHAHYRYYWSLLVLSPAEQCAPLQAGMYGYLEIDVPTRNNLCSLHAWSYAACMEFRGCLLSFCVYLHRMLTVFLLWTNQH